ncbi:MAG: RecX family transcriptional regulator [Anaerolineae bacterium]
MAVEATAILHQDMAGTITALKSQRKNKERVNVYLDGEYAFSLQAIVAARLRRGQVLSDEEIEGLLEEDAFHKAYNRALNFLSYRPRSRAEVSRYLQRKGVPSHISQRVEERLVDVGLLDDLAFARFWVENREEFRPRSRYVLGWELRQKGLEAEVIAQALQDINEGESAYHAAAERARRYTHLDKQAFQRKLGGFLRRRGFSYEIIKEVLDRLWRETRETEEP